MRRSASSSRRLGSADRASNDRFVVTAKGPSRILTGLRLWTTDSTDSTDLHG